MLPGGKQGIPAITWNQISRERLTGHVRARFSGGRRIENVANSGEVARPLIDGRNCRDRTRSCPDAAAFEAAEEKCAVLSNRASQRAAELILPIFRLARAIAIGKEVRAVENVVSQKLECRSVQLISPRFQIHEHRSTHAAAIFRGQVIGNYFELANCIDRRFDALRLETERSA